MNNLKKKILLNKLIESDVQIEFNTGNTKFILDKQIELEAEVGEGYSTIVSFLKLQLGVMPSNKGKQLFSVVRNIGGIRKEAECLGTFNQPGYYKDEDIIFALMSL